MYMCMCVLLLLYRCYSFYYTINRWEDRIERAKLAN